MLQIFSKILKTFILNYPQRLWLVGRGWRLLQRSSRSFVNSKLASVRETDICCGVL